MKRKKQTLTEKEKIEIALRPLSDEQIDSLSASELRILLRGEQQLRKHFEEGYHQSQALNRELQDKKLLIEGQLVVLKCRLFCPKSERSKPTTKPPINRPKRKPQNKTRDLIKRYPDADVIEKEVRLEQLPLCSCCSSTMQEMGIFEQSQKLTVIPKKYLITNILRMKYHCPHCHSSVQTAPQLPTTVPRGSYSDEFITDVALSKFCDLIPVDRYCEIASRGGFSGLPANSLYEVIWKQALFLNPIYELIRIEALDSWILCGDETPHKMLEGHDKKKWYLWGFFSLTACFFECHDTRAGDVACDVLSESGCQYFMSDAYSGYSKALRETNELRKAAELDLIIDVLCNAHARRYFKECIDDKEENRLTSLDADTFVAEYKIIYKTEDEVQKLLSENKIKEAALCRANLAENFEKMRVKADSDLTRYSSHHNYYKACQYLLNNYKGLTSCLKDPRIPLDNNISERGLRSHVVGRKTWYGTHSEKGAQAAAIHFTIIETCKLVGVNPREYYLEIIEAIHYKKPLTTPSQYKAKLQAQHQSTS